MFAVTGKKPKGDDEDGDDAEGEEEDIEEEKVDVEKKPEVNVEVEADAVHEDE